MRSMLPNPLFPLNDSIPSSKESEHVETVFQIQMSHPEKNVYLWSILIIKDPGHKTTHVHIASQY